MVTGPCWRHGERRGLPDQKRLTPTCARQGDRVFAETDKISVFSDLPPSERAKWTKELTHTALSLLTGTSSYEPWAHGVRCAFIFLTEDTALPLATQQLMAKQLGPGAPTVTLKANHCPHISMPDQLVDAIQELDLWVPAPKEAQVVSWRGFELP